jgi:hypothetical protein
MINISDGCIDVKAKTCDIRLRVDASDRDACSEELFGLLEQIIKIALGDVVLEVSFANKGHDGQQE